MSTKHTGPAWHACGNCSMRSFCLAGGLEGGQLEKFESSRGNVRILQNGQHLFRTGEKFTALYVVRSGMVKTMVMAADGEEQITGFYLPGEVLGMDGVGNDSHNATAASLETSSVCVLPFQKLAALGRELPALQQRLWRQTGREIANRQELLLAIGHRDADARIAGFLLSLSVRFKRIGYSATSFLLPMPRHDIGNYLGVTLETVSRVLTRFDKAGLISKDRRNISLTDVAGLSEVCYGGNAGMQGAGMPNRRTAQAALVRSRSARAVTAAAA
ncbi:MAG: helix-turn-helix domain-containing protein [Gammaproteobacteria bacterium]|jgi:CRP/FNR family transcriptional regulator